MRFWWRWGESNPRPEQSTEDILQAYMVLCTFPMAGTITVQRVVSDCLKRAYPTISFAASRSFVARSVPTRKRSGGASLLVRQREQAEACHFFL